MRSCILFCGMGLFLAGSVSAQPAGPANVVRTHAKRLAIEHVTVVDGTGAAPKHDETVLVEDGRIVYVGALKRAPVGKDDEIIDGRGMSLIPGLVGMHEHMFYPSPVAGPPVAIEQFVTAPLLYLASGVTTARTAGSMDPYGDLSMKRGIDAGRIIGPDLDLTTPYLEGSPAAIPQMHELTDADDARRLVRYWHDEGFSSVKAYSDVTTDELAAGIDEAHRLGMKITGHLCSVGYAKAIELGMDNFEHGPFASPDGDLEVGKIPDMCRSAPDQKSARVVLSDISNTVSPDGDEANALIRLMVEHHVPLTSTLAVLEGAVGMSDQRRATLEKLLHPVVWNYLNTPSPARKGLEDLLSRSLKKEMVFEHAFAKAGGVLMAGCDPTGEGFTFPGLGDQRNVELLVQAGFTVPEAIRIATLNGAIFEGRQDDIGSIEVGKRADLVLLQGDIANDVSAIERPSLVFKKGVGYDSQAIYQSVAGQVGLH
ncbi:amidohydrolase family protein [Luteibacter sp. CQ10]|uniref:amidohydrolase family protein n=1 Tax=Luteibacter sp. CQ10 TaxID=2805821 RepID=UPI0034A43AAD